MKYHIQLAICFLLTTSLSTLAQVRTLSPEKDFNSIRVSTGLFAEIATASEENKIEIKGAEREKVKVEIKNGELRLSLPAGHLFTESEILVKVYVKSLDELKARSGSEVEFITEVHQNKISLTASEGSYIGGELKVESLSVKSITGASVSLLGSTEELDVEVKTGGSYDGQNLISETTNVSISYGGSATVHATESCTANVTAGGSIEIFGNPTSIEQKTKMGGSIQVVN
jgi:hypothetical protein